MRVKSFGFPSENTSALLAAQALYKRLMRLGTSEWDRAIAKAVKKDGTYKCAQAYELARDLALLAKADRIGRGALKETGFKSFGSEVEGFRYVFNRLAVSNVFSSEQAAAQALAGRDVRDMAAVSGKKTTDIEAMLGRLGYTVENRRVSAPALSPRP